LQIDLNKKELPMKASVLGSALAISILLTVPAGARGGGGGFPPMVGPSYPFPSYCEQCFLGRQAPPPARFVVRHKRHHTGANAAAR
jgi:hypothetical protein